MLSELLVEVVAPVGTAGLIGVGAFVYKVVKTLNDIKHQVYPNDGGSLFDGMADIKNALVTHDAKFKAYQDADRVKTFETDTTGRITWTNTGIEKLFGRSADEMSGFDWLNGVHVDEQEAVGRRYKQAFADRRGFDCNVMLRDGRTWVHIVASPIGVGKSACYAGHCEIVETKPNTVTV